jgi:hypothetical protein
MYEFKRSLIALTGVLILVGIATITRPLTGRGASGTGSSAPTSQTQNVNVVNTPTVNAQQSGTWNVGITGTPVVGLDGGNNTVKVDTTNPLPVRDVDNPARQPFQEHRTIYIADGTYSNSVDFTMVPANKREVIEFVSVLGLMPPGQSLRRVGITVGDNSLTYSIGFEPRGPCPNLIGNGLCSIFEGSQQVRLYQNAYHTPQFFGIRSDTAGTAQIDVEISGYFVDIP